MAPATKFVELKTELQSIEHLIDELLQWQSVLCSRLGILSCPRRPPYCPPRASTVFIRELSELLTSVCPMYPSILLLGDLNIHADSTKCSFAAEFLNLHHSLEFSQHVNFPTHAKGHILDLVCSSGISPSNLYGSDLSISDHKAVFFNARIPAPSHRLRASCTITYRNLKNINISAPNNMLDTQLSIDYSNSPPDELVSS